MEIYNGNNFLYVCALPNYWVYHTKRAAGTLSMHAFMYARIYKSVGICKGLSYKHRTHARTQPSPRTCVHALAHTHTHDTYKSECMHALWLEYMNSLRSSCIHVLKMSIGRASYNNYFASAWRIRKTVHPTPKLDVISFEVSFWNYNVFRVTVRTYWRSVNASRVRCLSHKARLSYELRPLVFEWSHLAWYTYEARRLGWLIRKVSHLK